MTDRILSFEQAATDWTPIDGAIASSDLHVDGAHSGAFTVTGWNAQLVSPKLTPLGPIGSTATLELELPANLNGQSWQGQISLAVDAPSAGVYSQHTNAVQFQSAPVGSFQHIQFTLAPAVVSALSAATVADLQFTLIFGMAPNAQSFLVDKLNFGQSQADGGTDGGGVTGSGASSGAVGGAGGTAGAGGASGSLSSGGGAAGTGGSAGVSGGSANGNTAGTSGASGGTAGEGTTAGSSGPCTFSAPASGSTTDINFTIKLPHGVHREDVGIATEGGYLTLDDGVQVVKDGGGFASISSVAAVDRTNLGVAAAVQDVYTEATGVDLRSNAHVHGNVKTAADLIEQAGAVVDGIVSQNASLQPLDTIDWTVSFPNANSGSCSLEPDSTEVIDPGSYGDIAVKSRSHLKIRSGTYHFNSLSFEPQSVLDIDNTAGPVFIYVKTSFAFSGTVADADPSHMNFLFGVAGTSDISIQSPFRGILVAPLAQVALPTEGTTGHVGSFFSRALVAHQNTLIHQRAFSPSEFCASDAACSSFCPCTSGANPRCSDGVRNGDETDVDCGGSCAACPKAKGCIADADCASGLVCGQSNGACFGHARDERVCWAADCQLGSDVGGCGSADSACGQNCACVNGCDASSTTNTCAAGEVCKAGFGRAFAAPTTPDVCVDVRCPSNDPALCGSPSSVCGASCVCPADCSHATCANPSDGCGGTCPNVCKVGDTGCRDDVNCPSGSSCLAGPSGTSICRPSGCAFRILAPPLCGTSGALCGDTCPACTPSCENRQCGVDPVCGQSCGSCGDGTYCSADGQCVPPSSKSTPTVPDGKGGQMLLPPLPPSSTVAVGALKGQFSVTDDGTAAYTIPIEVPPGRAGIEPALSLSYTSSHQNQDLGVGWHVDGLSKITRCPRSFALDGSAVAIQNDPSDVFCLDGKRLEAVSGTYGADLTEYRTLVDSFAKIVSHVDSGPGFQLPSILVNVPRALQGPDYFQVFTKDGRILTFGRTFDSLVLAGSGVRYSWLLNRVEDRSGNSMVVSYTNVSANVGAMLAGGQRNVVRPLSISYTGHGSTPGNRWVRFDYESRSDPQVSFFQGGVSSFAAERLSRVTTLVDASPVKNYHLQYGPGELSQVAQISECAGGDDSTCKAPTKFEYRHQGHGFAAPMPFDGADFATAGQLDADGDGAPDFLVTKVKVGDVPADEGLQAAAITTDIAVGVASQALSPAGAIAVNVFWDAIKGGFWGQFGSAPAVTATDQLAFGSTNRGQPLQFVNDINGIRCDVKSNPMFLLDYNQDGRDDILSGCNAYQQDLFLALSGSTRGALTKFPSDGSAVLHRNGPMACCG